VIAASDGFTLALISLGAGRRWSLIRVLAIIGHGRLPDFIWNIPAQLEIGGPNRTGAMPRFFFNYCDGDKSAEDLEGHLGLGLPAIERTVPTEKGRTCSTDFR
jgi:hypothetical protein